MQGIIVFVIFFVLLIAAVPIATAVGIASVFPGLINPEFTGSVSYVLRSMLTGLDSFPLLAIPMFVLSGIIMARGGVSRKLFDVFTYFIGDFSAGMPCAVVITCLFYGAISGSAPATVAAVGSMTIPILINLGYDKKFSTAIVAVAGGLGVIIPPSIPFILFSMASGESVGNLFKAGIIPGILIAVLLMGYAKFYCWRHGEDKENIHKVVTALRERGFLNLMKDGIWAILTPVIILGCIYGGIASPTEAAVISVFYALFVSLVIYKSLRVKDILAILSESVHTYGPLLLILIASTAFSRVLTLLKVPQGISGWILNSFSNPVIILLVINLFLLFVGMVMDTSPAILITTPILLPIITEIGMNPTQFGTDRLVSCGFAFNK